MFEPQMAELAKGLVAVRPPHPFSRTSLHIAVPKTRGCNGCSLQPLCEPLFGGGVRCTVNRDGGVFQEIEQEQLIALTTTVFGGKI